MAVKLQAFNILGLAITLDSLAVPGDFVSKSDLLIDKNSTESLLRIPVDTSLPTGYSAYADAIGSFSYKDGKNSIADVTGFATSQIFYVSDGVSVYKVKSQEFFDATYDINYVGDVDIDTPKINYQYFLTFLSGDDVFIGSDAVVEAGNFDEEIIALAGNDNFTGNTGNDYFDGGEGIDTAIFRGTFGDCTLTASSTINDKTDSTGKTVLSGYLVEDKTISRDGTDSLVSVERLQFSDVNIALDTDASNSAGGIYRLYKAALDRNPDLGGLGYWIAQADAGAKDAVRMATDFTYADEFKTLYGVQTTDNYMTGEDITALVTKIYENVLDRAPDAGGRDYYSGQITANLKTVGQVLAEISDSVENKLAVVDLIATGIEYTPWVG